MQVVVFKLAGQDHAIDVAEVEEILIAPELSPAIEAPPFVEGVISLRGKIVPIVNLRKRLLLPPAPSTADTCILILRRHGRLVGLLADSASELLGVDRHVIEPPTEMVAGIRTRFIAGVVYLQDHLLVILELDAILSLDDHEALQGESAARTPTGPAPGLPAPRDRHPPASLQPTLARWEGTADFRRGMDLRRIIAFELGHELYGADIEDVVEILPLAPIMPLPNVPEFMVGLINLRGTIVPVIDLRIRFSLGQKTWDQDSRIIIMQADHLWVGVVVDRVWELLRLPPGAFQPPPPDVAQVDGRYFKEVSPVQDRLLIVLDIKRLLKETARKEGPER